jgi:hypothetical protein
MTKPYLNGVRLAWNTGSISSCVTSKEEAVADWLHAAVMEAERMDSVRNIFLI